MKNILWIPVLFLIGCATVGTNTPPKMNEQQLTLTALTVYMSNLYECELLETREIELNDPTADVEVMCNFIGTTEQYQELFLKVAESIGVENPNTAIVSKPNKKYKQLAVDTANGVVYIDPETGIW